MHFLGTLVSIDHLFWGARIIARVFLLFCYMNCPAFSRFSYLRIFSHLLKKWDHKFYLQNISFLKLTGMACWSCLLFLIIPSSTILRWSDFVLWVMMCGFNIPGETQSKLNMKVDVCRTDALSNFTKINLEDSWFCLCLFHFPLDLKGIIYMRTPLKVILYEMFFLPQNTLFY